MGAGHIPRGDVPVMRFGKGPGTAQDHRLARIRRFAADDEGLPLFLRAAACLMLLYAQPLSRILRLTPGDHKAVHRRRRYLEPDWPGRGSVIRVDASM